MLRKIVLSVLTAGFISVPFTSMAQEEPEITYRQKVMQANGANIGAISDILKFSLPLEANIETHAKQLGLTASLIPSAFEEEVSEGLTDARPEIWQEWDEFKQYAEDLKNASDSLAEVAAGGDAAAIGAQLREVGGACKQCHDEFRKPKEESYKNKM